MEFYKKQIKPVFLVDKDFNIIDKNLLAVEYFNFLQIGNIDKKIHNIFPIIKSIKSLDYISRLNMIRLNLVSNKLNAIVSVSKVTLNNFDYFVFTILDT